MQSASCKIMAGLDDSQTGIKTAGRNINNHRYADDNHFNGRKQRTTKVVMVIIANTDTGHQTR